MPPKKKTATKQVKQETKEESFVDPPKPFSTKIPQKPIFRIVKYRCLQQAKQARIKLWKFSSCTIYPISEDYTSTSSDKSLEFISIQRNPTPRKILKYVRKIEAFVEYSNAPFEKFFSPTWKLSSLTLKCNSKFPWENFLLSIVHPKIQTLSLEAPMAHRRNADQLQEKMTLSPSAILKALNKFSELTELEVNFPSFENSSDQRFKKGITLRKLKKLHISHGFLSPLNFQLSKLDNLEKIHLLRRKLYGDETLIFQNLSQLKNLKSLSIDFNFSSLIAKPIFANIANYSQLQALSFALHGSGDYPLELLMQLKNLRELSLTENFLFSRENQRPPIKFPSFEKLEKINLDCNGKRFSLESLQEALFNSSCLKEMTVSLAFQELSQFFDIHPQCSLERLSIGISRPLPPYGKPMKALTDFLKGQKQLKSLKLHFESIYADITEPTFKVLGSLTSLEDFTFSFVRLGELQDMKFTMLKDSFSKLQNLKTLQFFTKNKKTFSTELSSMINGFMKLKSLEKFTYTADFQQITPAVFNKFLGFVSSMRHFKNIDIQIGGRSKEDLDQLKELVYGKHPLWFNENFS